MKESDDIKARKKTETLQELRLLTDPEVKAAYEAMAPEFAAMRAVAPTRPKSSRKIARDALRRAIEAGRASGKPITYDPNAIKRRGRKRLGLRPRSSG